MPIVKRGNKYYEVDARGRIVREAAPSEYTSQGQTEGASDEDKEISSILEIAKKQGKMPPMPMDLGPSGQRKRELWKKARERFSAKTQAEAIK
jgi:hypothetical protein